MAGGRRVSKSLAEILLERIAAIENGLALLVARTSGLVADHAADSLMATSARSHLISVPAPSGGTTNSFASAILSKELLPQQWTDRDEGTFYGVGAAAVLRIQRAWRMAVQRRYLRCKTNREVTEEVGQNEELSEMDAANEDRQADLQKKRAGQTAAATRSPVSADCVPVVGCSSCSSAGHVVDNASDLSDPSEDGEMLGINLFETDLDLVDSWPFKLGDLVRVLEPILLKDCNLTGNPCPRCGKWTPFPGEYDQDACKCRQRDVDRYCEPPIKGIVQKDATARVIGGLPAFGTAEVR